MQVKGLEAGMHEPRVRKGLGLGFMVNPNGADHCSNIIDDWFVSEMQIKDLHHMGILAPVPMDDIGPRKVALFKLIHLTKILHDCMVACVFPPFTYRMYAELMTAVTGWDTSIAELFMAVERVLTVARLFNIKQGLTAADDVLPERYFQHKTDGILAEKPPLDRSAMEKAKNYYYKLMGWDEKGVPLPEKVQELYIE
jgi:aldehyde:ferredoxin oxidoreductase